MMTDYMQEHKAELVYCNYSRCDEQLQPILKDFLADKVVTFSNLLKTCRLAPVSTMYDTQRVGKFFIPCKSKREDHVMWLNLLKVIPEGIPVKRHWPNTGCVKTAFQEIKKTSLKINILFIKISWDSHSKIVVLYG